MMMMVLVAKFSRKIFLVMRTMTLTMITSCMLGYFALLTWALQHPCNGLGHGHDGDENDNVTNDNDENDDVDNDYISSAVLLRQVHLSTAGGEQPVRCLRQ